MAEMSGEIAQLQESMREIKAKISSLEKNTLPKDILSKRLDEATEKIDRMAEEMESATEDVRQHVNNLEMAIKDGSVGLSEGSPGHSRSRSVPRNRERA